MKIEAVKDSAGHVVATFERRSTGSHLEPVLEAGQRIEEVNVADNYVATLHTVYQPVVKR